MGRPHYFVLESSVRPLHMTLEGAGVFGGLYRLFKQLQLDFSWSVKRFLGPLPSWVYSPDFEVAANHCSLLNASDSDAHVVMELVRAQRRMRELIVAQRNEIDDAGREPSQPIHPPTMHPRRMAAIVRLCFGEMLEAFAEYKTCLLCATHEVKCTLESSTVLTYTDAPSTLSMPYQILKTLKPSNVLPNHQIPKHIPRVLAPSTLSMPHQSPKRRRL